MLVGGGRPVSMEIYHHLLGLPCIDEKVVWPTPVHKVLRQSSVLRVVIIADQADYGGVVRELEQDAAIRVVSELSSVEGDFGVWRKMFSLHVQSLHELL